jgi:hypothetical protein
MQKKMDLKAFNLYQMKSAFILLLSSICFLSYSACKNQDAHARSQDTLSSLSKNGTAGEMDDLPGKPYYIQRGQLELPAYSISLVSLYLFPSGSLQHDSSFYFKANFVTVNHKADKITDSLRLSIADLSNCPACMANLRNLTDTLQVQPLFIQLVTPGLDLYDNTYIGYRNGKLQELFSLGDTQEEGVDLQKTDESTLSGFTFGIDEIVGAVEHNYPVSINLKTFEVSHPLPEKQYVGFRTAAIENFRASRVIKGRVDSLLFNIKTGDSVTIDTFYRARQKVRLLVGDSVTVEIKLETAKKKVWHPAAAG